MPEIICLLLPRFIYNIILFLLAKPVGASVETRRLVMDTSAEDLYGASAIIMLLVPLLPSYSILKALKAIITWHIFYYFFTIFNDRQASYLHTSQQIHHNDFVADKGLYYTTSVTLSDNQF